jgi:hypothetical protein
MRSFRSDPYLWVHLAGVAAVPIFLELCLLGLGMGHSLMPIWFELLFVGGLGIAPILWMQWQKPFSIFSLLLLAVRSDRLSEDQRKILGLFKDPVQRFLSVAIAVVMVAVLWQLYRVSPIAQGVIFPNGTRGAGLLLAAIAFFFANLFLQVPMSVLRVLLLGDRTLAAASPYPVEQIPSAFTIAGLRVNKILPELIPKPSKPVIIRPVQPIATIEDPIVSIEEPTISIEDPIVSIEEPTISIEDPIVSIEEPTISIEDPIASVEEPTISIEDPIASVEDPTISIEDPIASIEDPTISIEDLIVSIEDSIVSDEVEPEGVTLEVIALGDGEFPDMDGEDSAIDPDAEDWGDDLDDL